MDMPTENALTLNPLVKRYETKRKIIFFLITVSCNSSDDSTQYVPDDHRLSLFWTSRCPLFCSLSSGDVTMIASLCSVVPLFEVLYYTSRFLWSLTNYLKL